MSLEISVIVPVYNVEKYVERCVRSLLVQDYCNYEIVLVDDGSPDRCPQICDDYACRYANVRCLHKPNGGLGDARNYGVSNSEGRYIVFVDSDDYVERTYLSDLYKLLKKFDADMAVTRVKSEKEKDEMKPSSIQAFNDYCLGNRDAIFEIYKREGLCWNAYGKIYKRELLEKNLFPKGYYEDCAVMYKILNDCSKIAIGDHLYNYHYIFRDGSILHSRIKKEHYRIFEICDEFDDFILHNYPEIDVLSLILKRIAVIQMLRLLTIPNSEYNNIFNMYKNLFRINIWNLLKDKRLSKKSKIYFLALCTNPIVFKIASRFVDVKNKLN